MNNRIEKIISSVGLISFISIFAFIILGIWIEYDIVDKLMRTSIMIFIFCLVVAWISDEMDKKEKDE